jgi:hypothetical protein
MVRVAWTEESGVRRERRFTIDGDRTGDGDTTPAVRPSVINVERSHGKLYDFGIKCRGSLVNPASYDTAPSSRMGVADRDGARVPQVLRKSADGRVVITVLAREFAIANASSAAKPK